MSDAFAPSMDEEMRIAPPESMGRRVWRTFCRDRRALGGLIVVGLMFVVAILAPFLANNKPLILVTADGAWRFPIFASMDAIDWRYLLYGVGSVLIFTFRRHFSVKVGWGLVLALIVGVEAFCALRTQVLDATDYKEVTSARVKAMPPIPYGPEEQTDDRDSLYG